MIKGQKRYILLPPSACPNLYSYPQWHPSARQSSKEFLQVRALASVRCPSHRSEGRFRLSPCPPSERAMTGGC